MSTDREEKQPLHPSIIPRLDPEYIEFHNSTILYATPPHTLPFDPSMRAQPIPGGAEPVKVGKTLDIDLTHTKFRSFTPEGTPPEGGWPVFIFFHGGGWTFGSINSEQSLATRVCSGAKCVVISVDYRLAPEHPYPAGLQDSVEALEWVVKRGKAELNIDASRIAVGGTSAGGNLAAAIALKAVERNPPIPLLLQVLIVPGTDNTKSEWVEVHGPWLSPQRMQWFQEFYLPNKEDRSNWDASPLLAPDHLLSKVTKAWVAVAELDILREEGVAYGKRMQELGVDAEIKVYQGAPHPFMAMDGALKSGKQLVADTVAAVAKTFGTST